MASHRGELRSVVEGRDLCRQPVTAHQVVSIQAGDVLPAAAREPRAERGDQAPGRGRLDCYPRVLRRDGRCHLARPVARSVVDHDAFPVAPGLTADAGERGGQRDGCVAGGKQHGDPGHAAV